MLILFLTLCVVILVFACFCVGLMIGNLFGRRRERRCACAEANRVLKIIEDRKKASSYSPEKVDPYRLPIVDKEST